MNSAEIESSERILRDMSKSAVLDQNHVNGVARTAQLILILYSSSLCIVEPLSKCYIYVLYY